MYMLFERKGWEPEKYRNMGPGQRRVVREFLKMMLKREDEQEKALRKEMGGKY